MESPPTLLLSRSLSLKKGEMKTSSLDVIFFDIGIWILCKPDFKILSASPRKNGVPSVGADPKPGYAACRDPRNFQRLRPSKLCGKIGGIVLKLGRNAFAWNADFKLKLGIVWGEVCNYLERNRLLPFLLYSVSALMAVLQYWKDVAYLIFSPSGDGK